MKIPNYDISTFHEAVIKGDVITTQKCLDYGIYVDATQDEYTALYRVISARPQNCLEMVKFLLEVGADPNHLQGYYGRVTPLIISVSHNLLEITKHLLKYGANPNLRVSGTTALHTSAISLRPDMIRLLIENGADVNAKEDDGTLPIESCQKSLKYWIKEGVNYFDPDVEVVIRKMLTPTIIS